MKTFTRAGISTNKGKTSFRFTNDLNRERVLDKNGHTDIQFWELGSAMTKEQATEFLTAQGMTENTASKPKARPEPTREHDEAVLDQLKAGEIEYDEQSDSFRKKVKEKREMYPSHTDEQLADIVKFQERMNRKAFGTTEVPF